MSMNVGLGFENMRSTRGARLSARMSFFDESEEKKLRTRINGVDVNRKTLLHLRQQMRSARNRPRHELREEHHKIQIIEVASRCGHVAAIDVDGVTDCVEGVEGYADRQHDVDEHRVDLDADLMECGRDAQREEIEIFEDAENKKIGADRDAKAKFRGGAHHHFAGRTQ